MNEMIIPMAISFLIGAITCSIISNSIKRKNCDMSKCAVDDVVTYSKADKTVGYGVVTGIYLVKNYRRGLATCLNGNMIENDIDVVYEIFPNHTECLPFEVHNVREKLIYCNKNIEVINNKERLIVAIKESKGGTNIETE